MKTTRFIKPICFLTFVAIAMISGPSISFAQDKINGFTEPLRTIDLASDETGAISTLAVDEGSRINEGEIVAKLDDRVQRLQVESARHLTESTSALEAARRALEKRTLITSRIQQLIETGHATDSELIRADLEESIARAKFVSAEEEFVGRQIDLRRAELLLERRLIRAPFNGVVSTIHRREGEFLSPVHPEIITLIQVDELIAVFNVPSDQIESMKQTDQIEVNFLDGNQHIGKIHSIGVQTDAESGTVQVKIALDNAEGKLRSGEQCYLEVATTE